MEFTYTAIATSGSKVASIVNAESEDAAVRLLQKQGMTILSLAAGAAGKDKKKPKTGASPKNSASEVVNDSVTSGGKKKIARKIKSDMIAQLSRELAIMIDSGVPIVESIDSIGTHSENLAITEMMMRLKGQLNEGKGLAESMSQFPKLFSSFYIAMVRTAEVGGKLSETLNQAAEYQEAAQEMRRKVKGAMAYPMVLLGVTTIVIIFMLTFVIPQFHQLFTRMKADIPIHTAILMACSIFLKNNWLYIPFVIGGGVVGVRKFLSTQFGKRTLLQVSLKIPGVGDLVMKVAIARLLRALGTLLESGVSLLVALDMSSQNAQNYMFEQAMVGIKQKVEEGNPLMQSMRESRLFPAMVCQMVAVGEKSGKLSSVLLRMAKYYEAEVDARLKMLSSILEPLMIVLIGVVVGGMAISIIGPIYSLTSAVK